MAGGGRGGRIWRSHIRGRVIAHDEGQGGRERGQGRGRNGTGARACGRVIQNVFVSRSHIIERRNAAPDGG
jgi:hypothetical protein